MLKSAQELILEEIVKEILNAKIKGEELTVSQAMIKVEKNISSILPNLTDDLPDGTINLQPQNNSSDALFRRVGQAEVLQEYGAIKKEAGRVQIVLAGRIQLSEEEKKELNVFRKALAGDAEAAEKIRGGQDMIANLVEAIEFEVDRQSEEIVRYLKEKCNEELENAVKTDAFGFKSLEKNKEEKVQRVFNFIKLQVGKDGKIQFAVTDSTSRVTFVDEIKQAQAIVDDLNEKLLRSPKDMSLDSILEKHARAVKSEKVMTLLEALMEAIRAVFQGEFKDAQEVISTRKFAGREEKRKEEVENMISRLL